MIRRLPGHFMAGMAAVALAGVMLAAVPADTGCSQRPVPQDQTAMNILKKTLTYIREHHPDAAASMSNDVSFVQTYSTGKDRLGYTGATYSGGRWTVSIGHPVVPDYAWDIKADYDNGAIVWVGLSKDGQIQEDSYTKK